VREEALYTFKEICELAGVPYSTGRYYKAKHKEFITPVGTDVSTGRNKRYTRQVAEVLTFISNAYKSGASANEVQQRLSQHFPMSVNGSANEVQCSVTTQCNQEENFHEAVFPLAPLALLANMAEQQQEIKEALQKIAEALERSRQQEQEIAKLKAEIEELKQPWWKRLLF